MTLAAGMRRQSGWVILLLLLLLVPLQSIAQTHSVARQWNEVLLDGIRKDFARPTVHARNLFHTSVVMYDSWAAYDNTASTYLLGQIRYGFGCPFDGITTPADVQAAREETLSFAVYRLLRHRFALSPGRDLIYAEMDALMTDLGYDKSFTSTNYSTGSAAALGNYIAQCMIDYGMQDGSNEANAYANRYYQPINDPLIPTVPGNPDVIDPNHWQPLTLDVFIDQGGNVIPGDTPPFLGPEWGRVHPFSLTGDDLTIYEREGNDYWVYHDPGNPGFTQSDGQGSTAEYQWGFSLVALWSSHLDPSDGVMWDISPGAQGNVAVSQLPTTLEGLRDFYDDTEGGDPGTGRAVNPATGLPYEPNIVPRGDYTRVLAEFWADGPDSETPPGHWFTILNYVHDHPDFERRYRGTGPLVDDLEWDVKAYFLLGGAMHDCAVTAWGVKGYYDYPRPISAIRYMADKGQSSDPNLPNYDPEGIPLVPGLVELVEAGDITAGSNNQNVGKIQLFAWKGPNFINDPATDVAGVGWILAENWWPYQRPSFVTPPFAGYVSGHSTFSRAAAEILTALTGDEYFPGGMGVFEAPQNEFLVFEEGPSVDVTLQWATYRDASDQTSLSRIWGGIHPPVDDIPGRHLGIAVANEAFAYANLFFDGLVLGKEKEILRPEVVNVYPNPLASSRTLNVDVLMPLSDMQVQLMSVEGKVIKTVIPQQAGNNTKLELNLTGIESGIYMLQISSQEGIYVKRIIVE